MKSMTGFGRGSAGTPHYAVTVEISTVNRKQFDGSVWVPREWLAFEPRVLALLRESIVRGAVKCMVSVKALSVADSAQALAERLEWVQTAAQKLGIAGGASFADVVALSTAEGVAVCVPEPTDEVWNVLEQAVREALGHVCKMREHEGVRIAEDLRKRLKALHEIYAQICTLAPALPKQYRDTLSKRLKELLPTGAPLDHGVLEREVALFADRCDISEELTRLGAHFAHAETLLTGEAPCGRPLDFLCQEFFREINTTGSKCSSGDIARQVIAFKTLLETFREQVQNLE